jgi:hypothetical protein
MQKQIYKGSAYVVETSHGNEVIPVDVAGDEPNNEDMHETLAQYCEGEVYSYSVESGYLARMSAPGYLDCTSWELFSTADEASAYLDETYSDDEGEDT